jgi:hypothetical protein
MYHFRTRLGVIFWSKRTPDWRCECGCRRFRVEGALTDGCSVTGDGGWRANTNQDIAICTETQLS